MICILFSRKGDDLNLFWIPWLCLSLVLVSCHSSEPRQVSYREIAGRDPAQSPLYRVKVLPTWEHQPRSANVFEDTTRPLCEFRIVEEIEVTIHNFPGISIPPQAQVNRWQAQFEHLDHCHVHVTPQAFSGFIGLKLEATGIQRGKAVTVLGWSLQLAPLFLPYCETQTAADVTIKVVGPKGLMAKYCQEIEEFARGFEFIEELKTPQSIF